MTCLRSDGTLRFLSASSLTRASPMPCGLYVHDYTATRDPGLAQDAALAWRPA